MSEALLQQNNDSQLDNERADIDVAAQPTEAEQQAEAENAGYAESAENVESANAEAQASDHEARKKLMDEAETLATDLMTIQGRNENEVIMELIRFGLTEIEAQTLYQDLKPLCQSVNITASNRGIYSAIGILIGVIIVSIMFGGVSIFGIICILTALFNLFYNIKKRLKA